MLGTLVWIALAAALGYYAQQRGRNPWVWGIASLVVSPLLCLVVLLILDRR